MCMPGIEPWILCANDLLYANPNYWAWKFLENISHRCSVGSFIKSDVI